MEKFKNTILVPTDLAGSKVTALEQAVSLAKITGSDITLLHVRKDTKKSIFYNLFSSKEEYEKMRKAYLEMIDTKMKDIAKDVTVRTGIKVHSIVEKGKASDVVVKTAAKISASYIVMKLRSDATEKGKKVIGTNALKIIKESACPVITCNTSDVISSFKNIILPLDLSKDTKQKVTQAVHLAKLYDSTIKIVSAIFSEDKADIASQERHDAQVKKFIQKHKIPCTIEFIHGDKKSQQSDLLLKYAQSAKGDIVLLMTQEESDWNTSYIGSTTLEMMTKSKIPVMLINPVDIGVTGGFN